MSPNQTCDDLPGPGRLIDTYFYQPGGRFLEDHINRFLAKRQSRKEKRQFRMLIERESLATIDSVSDAIHSFYDSKFLTLPEDHALACNHSYWTRTGQKSIRLDLSEYLYIWGAQEMVEWDDRELAGYCSQINNFVRKVLMFSWLISGRSDAVSYSAFYNIVSESYLRVMDLPPDWKVAVGVITGPVFNSRRSVDNLFQILAEYLPKTRITLMELCQTGRKFLQVVLVALKFCLVNLGTDFWIDSLYDLVYLVPLFELHDLRLGWNDPVLKFWTRVKESLDESLVPPRIKVPWMKLGWRNFNFLLSLEMRLMDTLRSIPVYSDYRRPELPGGKTESEVIESFIRLCFEVLVRLFAYIKRSGRANKSWINSGVVSKAKLIVDSRSVLGMSRINAIWDECQSEFAS
ncbi:hypothetical protein J3R30DRAFT_3406724 [Lentinula aciculospora]|uniref:Uncharacterized protein n=1 Tax=Lentinula aciculospora TaxID=153920 RepID=A0A9W9A548_9AGAR|nr:hypothetical protein J3R30DRAFT_3406724 [Lentinula aciculospora]